MNSFYKNLALWLLIGLIMVTLFNLFQAGPTKVVELEYSDFLAKVEEGKIAKVEISEKNVKGTLKENDTAFKTYIADDPDLIKSLKATGVKIVAKPPDEKSLWMLLLINAAPFVLFLVVWIFFMRQMQMGGSKALSFGKSKARLLTESAQKVTFKDVAGADEAKEEVSEIIDFLKDPQRFTKLGGRIPKGVLLVGPPGTGKTLMARAIAGEAKVPFYSISGSDFVEMFVGVGASRVRDLFEQGKKHAPCIIFIDEIDAVGRHRGAGLGGGHDEREQTLNQLLVEMDGFESNEGVILVAATNRPDVLDPALLRPGRFDRQVVIPAPDVKGREGILGVHTLKIPLAPDVVLSVLARGTPGFSGADLANLVNEAALHAARTDKKQVEMSDFEMAKDKVMMGAERRSMIISEDEKKIVAYHESGHALVARKLPGTDPIHKVTIIPRGLALGLTQQLPTIEKHLYPREFLANDLAIYMGGRAAEELVLGHMTTGAGNDIERATNLARKMVCEWGMSEKLGPLSFGKKVEQIFLGREFAQHKDYSEQTAVEIDAEVRRIVMENYAKARTLLSENLAALNGMAAALLEKESLDGPDIDRIIAEHTPGGAPQPPVLPAPPVEPAPLAGAPEPAAA